MKKFDVTSISQLQECAQYILNSFVQKEGATLLTLSGDLGSGKTTFTQELGALLEIDGSEINSPTYVIEQRYPISNHSHLSELVHIDAYRLEQKGDPIKIGLDQTLKDPTKLVVIEWPEKIATFLQEYEKIELTLSFDTNIRTATIK